MELKFCRVYGPLKSTAEDLGFKVLDLLKLNFQNALDVQQCGYSGPCKRKFPSTVPRLYKSYT